MDATKIVAGGSAGGLGGVLLVYLGQRLGWNLTATDGASAAAGLAAVVAVVAHNGILGIVRIALHGTPQPAPLQPAPPPPL